MRENDIKIWNYGDYSSDNYGSSRAIKIGRLTLYFSYDTIVAFSDGYKRYVCQNVWSKTTGKHLNWIDGGNKEGRLPYEEFKQKLEETLKKYNLIENDNEAIITKVSKEDLKEAFKDNKKALKIIEEMDSDDLQRLAERMANDYIEQLYWDSLKIIFTEMFLEGKEEG